MKGGKDSGGGVEGKGGRDGVEQGDAVSEE
jgi:hypothetical protein